MKERRDKMRDREMMDENGGARGRIRKKYWLKSGLVRFTV